MGRLMHLRIHGLIHGQIKIDKRTDSHGTARYVDRRMKVPMQIFNQESLVPVPIL